jgi:DnaJ-class molecular chaperone
MSDRLTGPPRRPRTSLVGLCTSCLQKVELKQCSMCRGEGRVKLSGVIAGKQLARIITCPECRGSRVVYRGPRHGTLEPPSREPAPPPERQTCTLCHGQGWITANDGRKVRCPACSARAGS